MKNVVLCADTIEYALTDVNCASLQEEFLPTPDWLTEAKFHEAARGGRAFVLSDETIQ